MIFLIAAYLVMGIAVMIVFRFGGPKYLQEKIPILVWIIGIILWPIALLAVIEF